jgi:hypothetical protein
MRIAAHRKRAAAEEYEGFVKLLEAVARNAERMVG